LQSEFESEMKKRTKKKKEKKKKRKRDKWDYYFRSTNLDCRHVGCGKVKTYKSVPYWRKQEESNIEESNEKSSTSEERVCYHIKPTPHSTHWNNQKNTKNQKILIFNLLFVIFKHLFIHLFCSNLCICNCIRFLFNTKKPIFRIFFMW
jgi:hypothetical protein